MRAAQVDWDRLRHAIKAPPSLPPTPTRRERPHAVRKRSGSRCDHDGDGDGDGRVRVALHGQGHSARQHHVYTSGEESGVTRGGESRIHRRRDTILSASCKCAIDDVVLSDQSPPGISYEMLTSGRRSSRRFCNSLLIILATPIPSRAIAGEVYSDAANDFQLVPPPRWESGSKSGASAFFTDPDSKFNNLGVTITPVKIATLQEFGTAKAVADSIIAFEKKKESTKEAILNDLSSRTNEGADQLTYYDFDYTLSSTRGNKRVVSTVCVYDKKLYIVNGQYFCKADACKDEEAAKLGEIRRALKSFSIINM